MLCVEFRRPGDSEEAALLGIKTYRKDFRELNAEHFPRLADATVG